MVFQQFFRLAYIFLHCKPLRLRVFWRRLDEDSGQASIEEFGCAPQGRNGRAAKMRLEKMAERKVTVEYEMVMILVFTSSWCNLEEGRFISIWFMAHSRIFMWVQTQYHTSTIFSASSSIANFSMPKAAHVQNWAQPMAPAQVACDVMPTEQSHRFAIMNSNNSHTWGYNPCIRLS